jgi:hypothetical protein
MPWKIDLNRQPAVPWRGTVFARGGGPTEKQPMRVETDSRGQAVIRLKLPYRRGGRPSSMGASWWNIAFGRVELATGRLLNWLKIPGAVRDVEFKDALTGQQITVKVGSLFTCVTVGGRDYYFRRVSGKFDGTGMGCD